MTSTIIRCACSLRQGRRTPRPRSCGPPFSTISASLIALPSTSTGGGTFMITLSVGQSSRRESCAVLRNLRRSSARRACSFATTTVRCGPSAPDLLGVMRLFAGSALDTPRLMNELFDLKRADALGKAPSCHGYIDEIERMREMVRELVANGEAYSTATLALKGRDLIAAAWPRARVSGVCSSARSRLPWRVRSPIARIDQHAI